MPVKKEKKTQWQAARKETHRIQSTAKMSDTCSVGRPMAVSTSSMVTRPALGMLAAPMLARVEVRLRDKARP